MMPTVNQHPPPKPEPVQTESERIAAGRESRLEGFRRAGKTNWAASNYAGWIIERGE